MSTDVVCPDCGRMRPGEPWIPCPGCGRTRGASTERIDASRDPSNASAFGGRPVAPPPSSSSKTVLYVVLGVALFGCLGFFGLVGVGAYLGYDSAKHAASDAPSQVVQSSDGLIVVHTYGGLAASTTLHDEAQLQLQNPLAELYLLGFSEPKEAFEPGFTLASYGNLIVSQMAIENAEVGPPTPSTVGGRPAIEYRVAGIVSHLRVVYWITVVESESHFHQLVGWTLAPRENVHSVTMHRVLREATVRSTL